MTEAMRERASEKSNYSLYPTSAWQWVWLYCHYHYNIQRSSP